MSPVEALARAIAGPGWDNSAWSVDAWRTKEAKRVVGRLHALGFDVVPIEKATGRSFSPSRLPGKAIVLPVKRLRVVVAPASLRAMVKAAEDQPSEKG